MKEKQPSDELTSEDLMLVGFGAVAGYCLVYFCTYSVTAALLAGIPSGAGGNALILPLFKKLRPALYLYYLGLCNTKITRPMMAGVIAVMCMATAAYMLFFPDNSAGFVILVLDGYVILFLLQSHFREKTRRDDLNDGGEA